MRGSVELSLFTCWGRLSLGSLHSQIRMYNVDAEDPDVNEYQHLPDTEALAERLRVCLQVRVLSTAAKRKTISRRLRLVP